MGRVGKRRLMCRFIRDSLVKEGKLELAFRVTANYVLDAEPVWAAWGISLIRASQFDAAREKFKYCISKCNYWYLW
jgi:hypothetical protein